ncbi:trypsin-like serine protease [Amycolatopsis sp. VS8301801F10]|uniref:trypsin-like serine protease n=1 Tax=Amycolatopsis sp. VS8301801F10 TaxID=2652442 RepID=UPI0038FCA835
MRAAGSERQHSGGTIRRIERVVTHPGYALQSESIPFNRNDIALLKLDRPVAEKPIRLASHPGAPGAPTRLLGFGTTVDTYDPARTRRRVGAARRHLGSGLRAGGPGLYSSVPAYADWIRWTIRSNRGGN